MTLVNVKNSLLSYFMENDMFSLEDNSADITFNPGDSSPEIIDLKDALILAALLDMQEDGVIREIKQTSTMEPPELQNRVFVLTQALGNFVQAVEIGPYTTELLAAIVNAYAALIGDPDIVCNKMAVREEDILNLIRICNSFIQNEARAGNNNDAESDNN